MPIFGKKCNRIRRLLSDRLDSPLSDRAEEKVMAHLESCSECRKEFEFYQELKETALSIEKAPAPPYLWERISVSLDEHPWGEDERIPSRNRFAIRSLNGKLNLAGAMLSLMLVAVLSLSPGGASHESGPVYQSSIHGGRVNRDIEYVSLYLMANQDKFPSEVRDYYLGQIGGLNQRIKTIKTALERYPQNNHIKAQLAIVYRQKIELYGKLGLSHKSGGGSNLSGDFSGENYFGGGRYE